MEGVDSPRTSCWLLRRGHLMVLTTVCSGASLGGPRISAPKGPPASRGLWAWREVGGWSGALPRAAGTPSRSPAPASPDLRPLCESGKSTRAFGPLPGTAAVGCILTPGHCQPRLRAQLRSHGKQPWRGPCPRLPSQPPWFSRRPPSLPVLTCPLPPHCTTGQMAPPGPRRAAQESARLWTGKALEGGIWGHRAGVDTTARQPFRRKRTGRWARSHCGAGPHSPSDRLLRGLPCSREGSREQNPYAHQDGKSEIHPGTRRGGQRGRHSSASRPHARHGLAFPAHVKGEI